MQIEQETAVAAADAVRDAVTTVSVFDHVKNNRIEYLLALGILHLAGVIDKVVTSTSGICS